jgi:hypothetical protein
MSTVAAATEQGFESGSLKCRLVIAKNFQRRAAIGATVEDAGYSPFQNRPLLGNSPLLPGRDRPAVSLSQFFRTIPMIGERVSGRNPETLLYEADLHPSQQYRSRTGAQLD